MLVQLLLVGSVSLPLASSAPTPPTAAQARQRPIRGYNPCNGLNCVMSQIGEVALKNLADSISTNGMLEANFSWINLDDGVMASRDANGELVANTVGFPSGTLLPLAEYVNNLGLSLGAYTDRGYTTCEGLPGSKGHEFQDAATFVKWGVRYLKSDSCSSSPDFFNATLDYKLMASGLNATGEDVFFSLCGWFSGFASFSEISLADTWRIGTDVPNFDRFMQNIESASAASTFTGPWKGWPDVDMIGGKWSSDQETLHVCFIAIIGAPLLLSWNISNPIDSTLPLASYLNPELLSIHSDDASLSVKARGYYYKRIRGGAVTGSPTAEVSSPSLPIATDVPCDSTRANWIWTPNNNSSSWGTLESESMQGYCLGIWDTWIGTCIDPLAAQLVPCENNKDGCDIDARTWSVDSFSRLLVNASWGGNTPRSGPFLTQIGGVPSALFVQALSSTSPPPLIEEQQIWKTSISPTSPSGTRTTIQGSGETCLGVSIEGATSTNVWARWLENGDIALLFFNVGSTSATVTCDAGCFAQIGGTTAQWTARNVWTREQEGVIISANGYSTTLQRDGGTKLLRLSPQ